MEPEPVLKRELDDSGCVHDESPPAKKPAESEPTYVGQAQLLNLSDDVLLFILQYCSPIDLKALGYSCIRLGGLIRDRSLWTSVDARDAPTGTQRLHWMIANCLHEGTDQLHLQGYAIHHKGCMGHVNKCDMHHEAIAAVEADIEPSPGCSDQAGPSRSQTPYPLYRQHARLNIAAQQLPRFSGSPSWSLEAQDNDTLLHTLSIRPGPVKDEDVKEPHEKCSGPVFTFTKTLLDDLKLKCPKLTSLTLDRCDINAKATGISMLPPTLKKLSLRGVKCFNLPMDKSFLFKIQDYLPELEELDVSECEWMEPASLLPLSKMSKLQVLLMRDCHKMSEFVAYASLATRYGFKALKVLDMRGCPVGDSEVSALGWVVTLEELYLSPSTEPPWETHVHTKGVPLRPHDELDSWELQEPNYFTSHNPPELDTDRKDSESSEDIHRQVLAMKATLRPDSEDLDSSRSHSNNNGNTPEEKEKQDNDSTPTIRQYSRYGLRLRKSDSSGTPGPSNRGKNDGSKTDSSDPSKRGKNDGSKTDSKNDSSDTPGSSKRGKHDGSKTDSRNDSSDTPGRKKEKADSKTESSKSKKANQGVCDSPGPFRRKKSDSSDTPGPSKPRRNDNWERPGPADTPGPSKPRRSDNWERPGPACSKRRKSDSDTSPSPDKRAYVTITRVTVNVINDNGENNQNDNEDDIGDNNQNDNEDDNDNIPRIIPRGSRIRVTNRYVTRDEFNRTYRPIINGESNQNNNQDNDNEKNNEASTSRVTRSSKNSKNKDSPDSSKPSTSKSSGNAKTPDSSKTSAPVRKSLRNSAKLNENNSTPNNGNKKTDNKQNSDKKGAKSKGKEKDTNAKKQTEKRKAENSDSEEEVAPKRRFTRSSVNAGASTSKSSNSNNNNNKKPCPKSKRAPRDSSNEKRDSSNGKRDSSNEKRDSDDEKIDSRNEKRDSSNEKRDSSESDSDSSDSDEPRAPQARAESNGQFIRFRMQDGYYGCRLRENRPPEVVRLPSPSREVPQDRRLEPSHHLLYVNVGERFHTVYRYVGDVSHRNRHPLLSVDTTRVDARQLVTDAAIRGFGRSEVEDVNYVLIGPNGLRQARDINDGFRDIHDRVMGHGVGNGPPVQRPDRVNLRILSITGYTNITDRSLTHLAWAAPHLRSIDVTGTSVSEEGMRQFKALRPDCQLIAGVIPKTDDNDDDE